jgi:hypothetical protein
MEIKYESEFVVSVTGDTTGEKFEGKFKVRTRLSFRDQLRRDEIRRTILGVGADAAYARASSAADMFGELSVRVIESPTWWKNADNGLDLADDNVLSEVYKKALKAEKDLVDSLTKQGEQAKKDLQDNQPALPGA